MDDLISRQAVLDEAFEVDTKEYGRIEVVGVDAINSLPSVKPQTGHWININKGKWNTIPAYKCSVCGENAELRYWDATSLFCPWCGAKMVEPQEDKSKTEFWWNVIGGQREDL